MGAVLEKCGFSETSEVRPTHALGRGGQLVLARRYAVDLGGAASDSTMSQMRGENRKPA